MLHSAKQLALFEEYLAGNDDEADAAQHNGNKNPSKGRQRLDKWVNRLREQSSSPRKREPQGSAAGTQAPECADAKQPAASGANTVAQSRAVDASKLARWVSRSSTASPMPTAASPVADEVVASKLDASEAGVSVKPASSDSVELNSSNAAATATVAGASGNSSGTAVPASKLAELPKWMPEFSSTEPASHPYVNGFWASKPVAGSAMEAWMVRVAARQLHSTWTEKRRDYCDETLLLRGGLPVEQIHAQRYHYNPPDINRRVSYSQAGLRAPQHVVPRPLAHCFSLFPPHPPLPFHIFFAQYSSILDSRTNIVGCSKWGRSCLDSRACWSPAAHDGKHWMEMDLGRNRSISGVVTQGWHRRVCAASNQMLAVASKSERVVGMYFDCVGAYA